MGRTAERVEFLGDVLVGAIENYGYGWFLVEEYHIPEDDPSSWFADIIAEDDDEKTVHHVDLDVLARGFGVIRDAKLDTTPTETRYLDYGGEKHPYEVGGETVLHNAKTGQRLFMSEAQRANILLTNRTNGDDGDMDVIDYLAVLECALFGQVVYA